MKETTFKHLSSTLSAGILTVFLNRPDVHNAFNDEMLDELIQLLTEIREADDVRIVIFTGKGKSFSAGADINWMKRMIDATYEESLADSLRISKVFYAIYTLNKPVISAVNGAAIGGGMGFVGSSDLVIASEKAVFSLSEVRIGMVPACISPYLIRRVGEGILKELFISGDRIDAARALKIGLVNRVVPASDLMDEALERAARLLKSGPEAIAVCKDLFHKVPEMDLETAHDYTAEVIARRRLSAEAQEGMRAFLAKRQPAWLDEPDR